MVSLVSVMDMRAIFGRAKESVLFLGRSKRAVLVGMYVCVYVGVHTWTSTWIPICIIVNIHLLETSTHGTLNIQTYTGYPYGYTDGYPYGYTYGYPYGY